MSAPQITVNFDPPLASDGGAAFDTKAFDTVGKLNPWGVEANVVATYCNTQADNALAAALGGDLPPITGRALQYLRVNAGETAAEFAAIPELTQAQAEDDADIAFGMISGERLAQAVTAFAETPTTYGSVGSYVWAYYSTSSNLTENTTVAGSTLVPASVLTAGYSADTQNDSPFTTAGGTALTGTWRAMGRANAGVGSGPQMLFVRII